MVHKNNGYIIISCDNERKFEIDIEVLKAWNDISGFSFKIFQVQKGKGINKTNVARF